MCLIICVKIYNFQSFQKITAMKNLSKEEHGYGFDKMFNGWKSYYDLEPIVENRIIFYRTGKFVLLSSHGDTETQRSYIL